MPISRIARAPWALLLALALAVALPGSAYAWNWTDTSGDWAGDSGSGTWEVVDGTLFVHGQGEIPDYADDDWGNWTYGSDGFCPWFGQQDSIKSIVIDDEITSIGDFAFAAMYAATSAEYGNVTRLGKQAFRDCKLESVSVPDGVAEVPDYCFAQLQAESVYIPDSVKSIGECAFGMRGNQKLVSASIPDGCSIVTDDLDKNSFSNWCYVSKRCKVAFVGGESEVLCSAEGSYYFAVPATAPWDLEAGCTVAYDGDAPAKDADGAGHYSFAGWVTRDADGAETAVEANEDGTFTVTGDATFYASFTCEEHSYADTVVEATTEAGGYTEHVCSECGYAYRDAETPKLDEATAAVVDAIKALPESVEGDEAVASVKAAAEAYLALTDEERAAVAGRYAAALVAAQEKALEAVEASASAAAAEAAKQLEALEQAKAEAEADAAAAQASALKASSLKVTAKTVAAKAKKKTAAKASKAFSVTGAAGKVTFAKVKGNAKITVSAKGKVTVKKGLKKGKTYKVKVLVADAGTSQVAGASKVVTLKVKVK